MRILAVVKFNDREALVLDRSPNLKYTKYNSNTIIGKDGLFCSAYFYDSPSKSWQAFAGRKFDLQLTDGTVEHCHGQWWDGVNNTSRKIIGDNIIHITAASIDQLKKCYVFFGYTSTKELYERFRKNYKGKVWGYWEYDKYLKHQKIKHKYKKRVLPIIKVKEKLDGK